MYHFFGAIAASPKDWLKNPQLFHVYIGVMCTFTGALAAMSIDLLNCSGHAAAGTRHQRYAPGCATAGTRRWCDAPSRCDDDTWHQGDARSRCDDGT